MPSTELCPSSPHIQFGIRDRLTRKHDPEYIQDLFGVLLLPQAFNNLFGGLKHMGNFDCDLNNWSMLQG